MAWTIVTASGRTARQEDLPVEIRDVELCCLKLLQAVDRTQRERLVMTHKGAPLKDVTLIKHGDVVICALRTRGTSQVEKEDEDEYDKLESEVQQLFEMNKDTPKFLKRAVEKMRIPKHLIAPLTHLKTRTWFYFGAWLLASRAFYEIDLGPIFLLMTLFALMLSNLSTRSSGFSAYSIFNPGCRRLGGQLDEADVRRGLR